MSKKRVFTPSLRHQVLVTCRCGHHAPASAFRQNSEGKPLPTHKYQCPACLRIWTLRPGISRPIIPSNPRRNRILNPQTRDKK